MIKMKNKKAQTLQGWTEGIIIALLFVVVLGIVVVGMNDLYEKDHKIVGLETSGFLDATESYQKGIEEKYRGGEASFLAQIGLTLKTSWDIIFSTMNLVWSFITGGWIETITTDYMKLPRVVGLIFRMLYFLSIGFIILKILFKISLVILFLDFSNFCSIS